MVDTDVWSHLYTREADPTGRVGPWRRLLTGSTVAIATQTRAELLVGFARANWGPQRREAALARLASTATVPVSAAVVEAYVAITVAALNAGEGLHQKVHSADRWIAASAVAVDAPLLSGDGRFRRVPDLRLLDGEESAHD